MQPASYKILKSVSLLIFAFAVIIFVSSQIVTVASRHIEVRNEKNEIIGDAWIPHDYGTDQFISLAIMILSGIQFWTIRNIGNAAYEKQK